MSDVRFQVFVSSTYTDLVQERQAAISALLQLSAMPAGMELFPAADDEAWTLIAKVIEESDYYLLIIGGRYGSVTDAGISFTEKEYDYARGAGKPVMAFLHASPEDISVRNSDVDPILRQKLLAFTEKVKKAKHVKLWATADDLAGKIALSFNSFINSYPAIGWVRADSRDSPDTLKALASTQLKVAELEGRLRLQSVSPPAGASGLADKDERLDLHFSVRMKITNLNRSTQRISAEQTYEVNVGATWNAMFAEMGATMLNEASEINLRNRFDSAVLRINALDIRKQFSDWLQPQMKSEELLGGVAGKRKPSPQLRLISGAPDISDFEIALLQLDALGLIEQSVKKRAVSDRHTYWTLTAWGRRRLMQLRAVTSGATRPPLLAAEDTDDLA